MTVDELKQHRNKLLERQKKDKELLEQGLLIMDRKGVYIFKKPVIITKQFITT